ncbi:MAG TPA: hypothetical protein VE079_16310 [Ensifer sp.]|nr:hypothetical protein [Ensifer sp.]
MLEAGAQSHGVEDAEKIDAVYSLCKLILIAAWTLVFQLQRQMPVLEL